MTEIKRYDVQTKIICRGECGVVEDAGGPYILASDIDANALEQAIISVETDAGTRLLKKDAYRIAAHLSTILAAVRKQP